GHGQCVETSLRDGLLGQAHTRWATAEGFPPRAGTRLPGRFPVKTRSIIGLYQCADGGWLYLHTMAKGAFSRLMRLLELDQFARESTSAQESGELLPEEDARFLTERVPQIFASRARAAWVADLEAADIPVLPALPP